MFLKHKDNGDLIEVLTVKDLFAPYVDTLIGRYQHGEEMQDPETFNKSDLIFPSGEHLPKCWLNAHYRDLEMVR